MADEANRRSPSLERGGRRQRSQVTWSSSTTVAEDGSGSPWMGTRGKGRARRRTGRSWIPFLAFDEPRAPLLGLGDLAPAVVGLPAAAPGFDGPRVTAYLWAAWVWDLASGHGASEASVAALNSGDLICCLIGRP